jgi:lysophospholipase L1-like esterase
LKKIDMHLFGDSVARGIVLDEQGRYSPLKDGFAARFSSQAGVSLVNHARFGCTIRKGREFLLRFLSREEKPSLERKLAVLEFGGNDCDFRWDEIALSPDKDHKPAVTLDEFSDTYGAMIDALREKGYEPVAMTLPPLDAERYFSWFTRSGLDQKAILGWLGDVQQIYRWHEMYSDAVREIARLRSCLLFDVRKYFLESRNFRTFLCLDGIHPNEEGHKLMESAFEDFALRELSPA